MKNICLFVITAFIAITANAQLINGARHHSVILCSNGTVWTTGANNFGQLGNGTTTNSATPVQVTTLSNITAVAAGGWLNWHTLALENNGTVWAWGQNSYGQLGNGTNTNSSVPVPVSGLSNIVALAGGEEGDFSIALRNDGTVWTWGNNASGQLGNGTTVNSSVPVQVSGTNVYTAIAAGTEHALAIRNDSTVWAWGYNGSAIPVQVTGLTKVVAIAAGYRHSLAVRSNGTVWCWGQNTQGQLGNGTTTNSTTPVQTSSLSNIIKVAAGLYHSVALSADGNLWAWGLNSYGEVWDGTTNQQNSPVPATSPANIIAISAQGYRSMALRNDGTVWGIGENGSGAFGSGATGNSVVPVQMTLSCNPTDIFTEALNDKDILFYPNPSSGKFQIAMNILEKANIKIYNSFGAVVYQSSIPNPNFEIDLSNRPSGIYFYQVISAHRGQTETNVISSGKLKLTKN